MQDANRPRPSKVSRQHDGAPHQPWAPFAHTIGRTRYVVLLASMAVLLLAIALFLFGTGLAFFRLWTATQTLLGGNFDTTKLTVEFLEIVSTLLKAVIFYIVGVGFYSLFIAPLNLTTALGVETFGDLEAKVVSVIVVIMSITFLEHFIVWQQPSDTLQFGIALALVIGVLALFQFISHLVEQRPTPHRIKQARAQERLFEQDEDTEPVESDQMAAELRDGGGEHESSGRRSG